MIGYVSLAVTVTIVGKILWSIDDWGRDWTNNYAQLQDDASNPDLRPLCFSATPDAVREWLLAWVETAPLWSVQSEERAERSGASGPDSVDESPEQSRIVIHLTRRTRWMRFVDDIHVILQPTSTDSPESPNQFETRVWAESQSRVGKGDLGQNPRNLIELSRGLRAASTTESS